MILLFGNKHSGASKSLLSSSNKTRSKNNNPVENSGILAMSFSQAKSTLTMGEFDTYVSSHPVTVNYSLYADFCSDSDGEVSGFMGDLANAMSFLSDGGTGSFDAGSFGGCSGGCESSFASFG